MKIIDLLILLVILFVGSPLYAQGEQPEDANRHKAQELENLGEYIKAMEMYEKSVQAEKDSPNPIKVNIVTGLNQAAYYYALAGQYKTAANKIDEALKITKKLGRKDLTAECLNRFGYFYNHLKRYDVALEYYLGALDIYRKLEQEDKVATDLNYVGNTYNLLGQHDTAVEHLERALEIDKKRGREDKAARDLDNIGRVYETIGKYDNAIEYYEKALSLARKLGEEEIISAELDNIGNIYKSLEQNTTAIRYYGESLAIYRKLWKQDSMVYRSGLNKIGDICKSMGQYEKALKYYEEALGIFKNLDLGMDVAGCLNKIGTVYQSQELHEKAVKYFEDALRVPRTQEQDDEMSISFNNIGNVYETLDQYDKAIEYYEKALGVDRELSKVVEEGLIDKNLILYYRFYWNKHDKVIYPYEQTLALNRKIEKDTDIYRDLNRIGIVLISQAKYKAAITNFKDSVSIIEELRKITTGETRKRLLNDLQYSYQLLTFAYIKDDDADSAFQTVELVRAKLLIDKFAVGDNNKKKREKGIWPQEVGEIQKTLDDDTVIIVYANVNTEKIVQIAITRTEIVGKEVSNKSFIKSSIDRYDTQIQTLLINQQSLSENKNDFSNIVNYYGSLLRTPPLQEKSGGRAAIYRHGKNPHKTGAKGIGGTLYELLIKPMERLIKEKSVRRTDIYRYRENPHKTDAKEIGGALYELLIKPMEGSIKEKKNLIIVPDGILAFVPFEALADENGEYLVEKYSISYIQSLDVRKLIKKRKYDEDRKPLLAFGGAVYEGLKPEVKKIENRVQLAVLTKNIYSDLENIQMDLLMKSLYPDIDDIRSVGNAYDVLGISSWPDLPETLNEIHEIKDIIKKSNLFTGKNVTEREIKELSDDWKFYNYKVLHFATHGLIVPEVPELSALVLSQFKDMGKEDGYLRTEEIAKMEIRADLVNLSAFDTGLGEIYEDDGFSRIIHSFALSGAKAVSISLWRVADQSTSQFMATMYGMVQERGISYIDAITGAKRQFINGQFGEKYKEPYYWAPFVYYGN